MSTPNSGNERAIAAGDVTLTGFLEIPEDALGIVVFAHGSGSSRFSRRNNAVAEYLRRAGLGTLLFDLLTADEETVDQYTREHRFDIPLLSRRLEGAVQWLATQPEANGLPIGIFGSSTGAAAALIAAARLPDLVAAVVSRGGRADLAGDMLPLVKAPSLLVVGGDDPEVLRLNHAARKEMRCRSEVAIVAGATHLFEEPGTLDEVAALTRDWFVAHFQQLPGEVREAI